MRTVIAVPFRGDDAWRDQNFDVVLPRIESLGLPLIVADSGDEPFSIARTWNLLAEKAEPWDRLVRWAADFIIEDPSSVHAAIEADGHYTFAFDKVTTLRRRETRLVHQGGPLPVRDDKLPFGGVNVVSRKLWDTVGGFNERFIGWGHEDREFVHRVEQAGFTRDRVPGRMFNLWHPKRTAGDPYYDMAVANYRLYKGEG